MTVVLMVLGCIVVAAVTAFCCSFDHFPYCRNCDNWPNHPADRSGYCKRCVPPLDLYPQEDRPLSKRLNLFDKG